MLAMMCLESALPWVGAVTVVHDGGRWRLVGQADRVKQDPALWAWLGGDDPRAPAPSEVHFALLAQALADANRQPAWDMDEKGAEIAF